MENLWLVSSRMYNTVVSVPMKLSATNKTNDFRKPSYIRPTVLIFPNKGVADHFRKTHVNDLGKSCMVFKNRHARNHIQHNLSTKVDMVLVKIPRGQETVAYNDLLLYTCPISHFDEDTLLCLTLLSYALFYYIEHYYINESNNMVLEGVVINPLLKLEDSGAGDMIVTHLNHMLTKN
jgi:hypothetical protein